VTSPGISHSIHVAVVRLVDPFIGGAEIGHEGPVPGDADSAVFWAYMINVAWVLLGFACFVATATAVAVAVAVLVSDGAGDITFNVGAGAVFFCLWPMRWRGPVLAELDRPAASPSRNRGDGKPRLTPVHP